MCIRDRAIGMDQAQQTISDNGAETYWDKKTSQNYGTYEAVSYTHLDVYKRQIYRYEEEKSGCPSGGGASYRRSADYGRACDPHSGGIQPYYPKGA